MTVSCYPLDAVSGSPSYAGDDLRTTLAGLLFGASDARPVGAWSGVRIGTPTDTVTVSGSDWTCAPHAGVVDEHTSAVAGPYLYSVTVDETGTVDAAHATYARVDIIYVQIDDPAQSDGSSVPAATVNYLAGTAAASPTAPALPARSLLLAHLNVPASGGGATSVTWKAHYAAAAGGIIPVRDNTERDAVLAYVGSSSQAPLYVHHATDGLIVSTDGSTFTAVGLDNDAYNYRPANTAALNALTGMSTGDLAYQIDTKVTYRYSGTQWVWASPMPYVEYRLASAQTLTTATETTIVLDASPVVTLGGWSLSAGVVTVPVAGYISVTAQAVIEAGGSPTLYQFRVFKNGTTDAMGATFISPSVGRVVSVNTVVRVAAGDTLRVRGYHNAGANKTVGEVNANAPLLTLHYLSII